jgi:hypothetical protein
LGADSQIASPSTGLSEDASWQQSGQQLIGLVLVIAGPVSGQTREGEITERRPTIMHLVRILQARVIDPIVDRMVSRIASRLEKLDFSLSDTKKILCAQQRTIGAIRQEVDRLTRQRDETEWTYKNVIGELGPPDIPPAAPRRRSALCKQADFALDAYRYWSSALRLPTTLHRKHWEFFYVCQALYERSLLGEGRTGLGFGVGREAPPS